MRQGRAPRASGARWAALGLLAALAAGCRTGPAVDGEVRDPVGALQRINGAGARCWMRSSDSAFQNLSLVPELDTSTGRPRLLLLPKGRATGLPVLVIEASGTPATIETYGPLANSRTGARVRADIQRWSDGRISCN